MSLESVAARRTASPSFSGRSTPVQHVVGGQSGTREDDASLRKDKFYRRYAASIERALASFDPTQQEWADYIAFLARLLKAIQVNHQSTPTLPYARTICHRLAQCLTPSLPSGVHQKALEVVEHVFVSIGSDGLAANLDIYLPPLVPVLSFASLSIRPLLHSLFEGHILPLNHVILRPATKSIILCLLPGIEDETSEDFDRGLGLLDSLRHIITSPDIVDTTDRTRAAEPSSSSTEAGFFWQCFFLASITSPSKRQGALVYLTRRLPLLGVVQRSSNGDTGQEISHDASAVLHPEPGLLIRCFATGLRDSQTLIQRGFLDLLVSHLPLHSPVLHQAIQPAEFRILVSAAITVLLRRDMSLNRRLWAWLIGPEANTSQVPAHDGADSVPSTPTTAQRDSLSTTQANYFRKHGQDVLHDCVMDLFTGVGDTTRPAATQPYRILLSLLDRGEVAANLVPGILITALRYAQQQAAKDNSLVSSFISTAKQWQHDLVRSASLFFDAVESHLIWTKLVSLLHDTFQLASSSPSLAINNLDLLSFVIERFNVREEDMLLQHIPNVLLLTAYGLSSTLHTHEDLNPLFVRKCLALINAIVLLIPDHAPFALSNTVEPISTISDLDTSAIVQRVSAEYLDDSEKSSGSTTSSNAYGHVILQTLFKLVEMFARPSKEVSSLQPLLDAIHSIYDKIPTTQRRASIDHLSHCLDQLTQAVKENAAASSITIVAAHVSLILLTQSPTTASLTTRYRDLKEHLNPRLLDVIWTCLTPEYPRHHVEAVRLLWQLQVVAPGPTSAQLAAFFTTHTTEPERQYQACGRFAVLWDLTIHQHFVKRRENSVVLGRRRSSNPINAADLFSKDADHEQTLIRPLFMILDKLHSKDEALVAYIFNWLRNLSSLDRVFTIILSQLSSHYRSHLESGKLHMRKPRIDRQVVQDFNDIANGLCHILHILQRASSHTWQTLSTVRFETDLADRKLADDGLVCLALFCLDVLRLPPAAAQVAKQHALLILQLLLTSPEPSTLIPLHTEKHLLTTFMSHLTSGQGALQTIFLDTIHQALTLNASSLHVASNREQSQIVSQSRASQSRPSQSTGPQAVIPSQYTTTPPTDVIYCITYGFSAPICRLHLENWVAFMNQVFPIYGDSILTAMIPITECLCKQIDVTFGYLANALSKSSTGVDGTVPSTALSSLLTGLELLLANPYLNLHESQTPHETAEPTKSQHSIGSMVPGLFSLNGHEGRMSRVNSRLTLILCIQDSLRTCFSIWVWTMKGHESGRSAVPATATAALSSLRLRHRSKRMIDNFFFAEGLECLEALIFVYKEARHGKRSDTAASSVLTLLHTLSAARPRDTLPLILNALYSRTDPDALEFTKRSTLTCDLTSTDIVIFLLDYVRTMEDDAMDEIWTECTTFLRNVLSNPLPHRTVLPILLEVVVLIAEKFDNTNHGDQRKMHRELGDIFLRLLTATFTTRPQDHMSPKPVQTMEVSSRTSKVQNRGRDLLDSLVIVTERLGHILDGSDRITIAVNAITASIIAPSFHSKVFPDNVGSVMLQVLQNLSIHGSDAKLWRKEVADAFNEARFFAMPAELVRDSWFPLLRKWCLIEKDRIAELLTKIVGPATAGIMFGVGASAARTEADRKTQTTLRRISMLYLACDMDFFVASVQAVENKLAELLTASSASSPSSATRADIFMMCRALVLCNTTGLLSGLWPMINSSLVETLSSAMPGAPNQEENNNIALMQACKLLDTLVTLAPDDFQLHEWLYLPDTIDAVYKPADLGPSALSDQIAEALSTDSSGPTPDDHPQLSLGGPSTVAAARHPFLTSIKMDSRDMKAMARDDFVKAVLRPFFEQLGMHAYENTYGLALPDLELCRWDLLRDLLDQATIA